MPSIVSILGRAAIGVGLSALTLPAFAGDVQPYHPPSKTITHLNFKSPTAIVRFTPKTTYDTTKITGGSGSGGGSDPMTSYLRPQNGVTPDGGNGPLGGGNGPLGGGNGPIGGNGLLGNGGLPGADGGDRERNLLIACRTLEGKIDLRFRNVGDSTIPAGTRVVWAVRQSGDHGSFILPRDILVGKSVNAAKLLSSDADDDFKCASKLM